jgi:hypothetical protein
MSKKAGPAERAFNTTKKIFSLVKGSIIRQLLPLGISTAVLRKDEDIVHAIMKIMESHA